MSPGRVPRVIKRIFSASLRLQGLIEGATVRHVAALLPSVTELDDAIREIRLIVFETHRHRSSPPTPPDEEAP